MKTCCRLAALFVAVAAAQVQGVHYISLERPATVTARRGSQVEVPLRFIIRGGHHINSNQPAEEYLIPTALTWMPGALTPQGVGYPKPESVKYEFSAKPLLVWSGGIVLTSKFAVAGDAPVGAGKLSGKLRYQACNDRACFPPKTLEVSVPVTVQ